MKPSSRLTSLCRKKTNLAYLGSVQHKWQKQGATFGAAESTPPVRTMTDCGSGVLARF